MHSRGPKDVIARIAELFQMSFSISYMAQILSSKRVQTGLHLKQLNMKQLETKGQQIYNIRCQCVWKLSAKPLRADTLECNQRWAHLGGAPPATLGTLFFLRCF